ncbi:MAG: hypothetical protein DI585_06645 [Pseudomonas fluorescens]|nr:MAG: hypothetical protein DI585_06645 [Pseudomonas fluorescens]
MTGIRDCCLCIITDGNIYPESKCMRDMTVFEGLMNQLIALGYVQPHVIRNYSRLMEVAIRATLCDENPKVLQRQYKHRLEMLPYFD